MNCNAKKFREEKKKGNMSKSKEEVEECFFKCSMETKQSFTAALQIIYDEVFEINPYEDYIYILNSQYDKKSMWTYNVLLIIFLGVCRCESISA